MSSPSSPPPPPIPESSPQQQTAFDIGEEYGTARKSLPPAGIGAICLAVEVAIAAGYALPHRAHARSSGTIDDVFVDRLPCQDMVMVAINVSLQYDEDKRSWLHA